MTSSLIFLILGLGVGALLGYVFAIARRTSTASSGTDELSRARVEAAQWQARAQELSARVEAAEAGARGEGAVLTALSPIRSQLEQMGARVAAMEQLRAAQHGEISQQLRASAQREAELARTTASLEGALRSRSARGTWGELELTRILEASGMMPHVDFSEQRSIGTVTQGARSGEAARSRPDVTIHLPGDGFLAVDSKVPLDAYLRASEVEGADESAENQRRSLLDAHAKALRAHVDELIRRDYAQALGHSPDLVVLFVPSEAALSAALHADPALLEYASARGVALASPVSLLGLLRTCASAWARTNINEQAEEIMSLGRELYQRLGVVASHMEQLGANLKKSVEFYNKAVSSMESRLLVKARKISSLEATSDKKMRAPEIDSDAAQVRAFSAPELNGDA